jgi:4-hydroxy-2-oxoheptanedioate aldolase
MPKKPCAACAIRHAATGALMARAEAGILKSGVPIGGVARTAEQANQMIERGYVALALGFDWSLFQRGIAASFDGIKR